MINYAVEFWPGVIFQVSARDEEEALFSALKQYRHGEGKDSWPGASEHTSEGLDFKVWVRKVES